jgi:hypothetical protein
VLQLTPDNQGANGVYQEKHRYLALGIEIGNEAKERSRIKMIASLLKQQSLLLRLRLGTHPALAIKI